MSIVNYNGEGFMDALREEAAKRVNDDDEILKLSVKDDLKRIDTEYELCRFGGGFDPSNRKSSGAYFGVFDLMTVLSPTIIMDSLISVGERRSRLYKEICKSEGSTRIISEPPVETDLLWLFNARKDIYARWVAFPWHDNVKVLMTGNHPNGNDCFPESMVGKYSGVVFPYHMTSCYNRDMTWLHSDLQTYSAFVVDNIENVNDVISFISGCELAASYIDEIYDIDERWFTSSETPIETLSRCLEGNDDIYVIRMKRALREFVSVYGKLVKHPICPNKNVLNYLIQSFAVDFFTAKIFTNKPLKVLRELSSK